MTAPSIVLAIGGFDGSGGAGTLADARAIQLNGGYPCALVTAITAQNTTRVEHIEPVSAELIRRQMQCIVDDFRIDAIKIGLLPSVASVETLVDCLTDERLNCPVVVDPVMCATSGGKLIDERAIDALVQGLIPNATLITPNVAEASNLSNRSIHNLVDAITAGNQLIGMGCQNVLVKGGHLSDDRGTDAWCYEHGFEAFEPIELHEGTVRGTGCMLSSAIASHLGQGKSMRDAIRSSKEFVNHAISNRTNLGRGTPLTTAGIQV